MRLTQEVQTVSDDRGIIIGFVAPMKAIWWSDDIHDNHWAATQDLLNPEWAGQFPTQEEAMEYLEGLKNE